MINTTAPAFTHTADCAKIALGAAVQSFIANGVTLLHASALEGYAEGWQHTNQHCDCGRLALTRVENDLRLARKAQRAYNADAGRLFVADLAMVNALTFRITELSGQRNAIRAELNV